MPTRKNSTASPQRWALQDAKNRFSEVVEAALRGQPQIVTRRGLETAVIISHDEYEKITGVGHDARPSMAESLVSGPVVSGEAFGRITLASRRKV